MSDAFDAQGVRDRAFRDGLKQGMEVAARARCSNCADGDRYELYYGHPRRGGGFGLEWRHEAHHCQCGSWQVWDEMVRRGLVPTPEGWEAGPSHRVSMCPVHPPRAPHPGCKACGHEAATV